MKFSVSKGTWLFNSLMAIEHDKFKSSRKSSSSKSFSSHSSSKSSNSFGLFGKKLAKWSEIANARPKSRAKRFWVRNGFPMILKISKFLNGSNWSPNMTIVCGGSKRSTCARYAFGSRYASGPIYAFCRRSASILGSLTTVAVTRLPLQSPIGGGPIHVVRCINSRVEIISSSFIHLWTWKRRQIKSKSLFHSTQLSIRIRTMAIRPKGLSIHFNTETSLNKQFSYRVIRLERLTQTSIES